MQTKTSSQKLKLYLNPILTPDWLIFMLGSLVRKICCYCIHCNALPQSTGLLQRSLEIFDWHCTLDSRSTYLWWWALYPRALITFTKPDRRKKKCVNIRLLLYMLSCESFLKYKDVRWLYWVLTGFHFPGYLKFFWDNVKVKFIYIEDPLYPPCPLFQSAGN